MLTLDYGARDFDKAAWAAIDRHEEVRLVVRGEKRQSLKRALARYRDYFDAKRRGEAKLSAWLLFGWYGLRMPTFWGIYNHGELARMQVGTEETADSLVITFSPAQKPPSNATFH